MLNMKRLFCAGVLFLFVSVSFSQVVDPELERYFEKNYGYLKNDPLRDSPSSLTETSVSNLKSALITYTRVSEPNYTDIPLHYDIKKYNTSGPISYYVSNIKKSDIKTHTLVDIRIVKEKYSAVIKELSSLGFLMAGEEVYGEGSKKVVIFGWIDDLNFNRLKNINGVESFSVSSRNITAPLANLLITVKVPNNRDLVRFIDKFISKLGEYGFQKENVEIISNDKKYRFSIIKIKGKLPIDKTRVVIKSPFVIDVSS